MIVRRDFITGRFPWRKSWRGWFLFGFIPLFVMMTGRE